MITQLKCRIGLHAWNSEYDGENHQTNRTCRSCGKTRVSLITDKTRVMDAQGPSAMQGGPGIGGL